jgi:D-aminoacyl-tRNA deacylase
MKYNFLLIVSKKDPASMNFYDQIICNYNIKVIDEQKKIYKIETLKDKNKENILYNSIFLKIINGNSIFSKEKEIIPNKLYSKIDYVIFLSKHQTQSNIKPSCITVHAIGNFSKALYGGKDKKIVKTDPILIRTILCKLKKDSYRKKNFKNFEVKQEATHHGPYLDKKTIFYEIGSDLNNWRNKKLANYMIRKLIDIIKVYDKEKIKKEKSWLEAAGIGGSHYCTKFNRLTFNKENKYCFGHIIPSYAIEDFKKNKLDFKEQIFKKNYSKIILKENLEPYV